MSYPKKSLLELMNKIIVHFGFYLFCLAGILVTWTVDAGAVAAGVEWNQEFAEVCGKTHNAMAYSVGELENFIQRCEKLQKSLKELEEKQETEKKIYGKRLKMCRDLYVFALNQKKERE